MTEEIEKIKELERENAELKKSLAEMKDKEPEIIEKVVEVEVKSVEPKIVEKAIEVKTPKKKVEVKIENIPYQDLENIKKGMVKKVIEENPELAKTEYIIDIQNGLRELRDSGVFNEVEMKLCQSLIVIDPVNCLKYLKQINPDHPIFKVF